MRKPILMVGLVVVAIACSSAGDMIGEILDSGVPDAGAQQGELVVPCDIEWNTDFYASVSPADLSGAFTAFWCDYVDEAGEPAPNPWGLASGCGADCPLPEPVCQKVDYLSTFVAADGNYWFRCTPGGSWRATTVRILR